MTPASVQSLTGWGCDLAEDKVSLEKEIEDWLCEHPDVLLCGDPEFLDTQATILGHWRQVRCSYGIPDIVALVEEGSYGPRCYVIELKRGAVSARDLCQVLRYTNGLRSDLQDLAIAASPSDGSDIGALAQADCDFWERDGFGMDRVQPVLIARSISSDLMASALAASVLVYLYVVDTNGHFATIWPSGLRRELQGSAGPLGMPLRQIGGIFGAAIHARTCNAEVDG